MSTSVDSGQGPDISKLIKDYESNPAKNTKSKTKALNAIESKINQLSKETDALQDQLEQGYAQVQHGEQGLGSRDISKIRGDIQAKQKELSALKIQLARLAKYKKSQKLADRILSLNISLGELDGRAESINSALELGIPDANKLRGEINALLKEANKKTNRSQSGHLLDKAVEKYKELETIRDTLAGRPDEQRQLDSQMRAIRIKMTKIASKQLPLSKREAKFLSKYRNSNSLSDKKKLKHAALEMRVAVGRAYFPKAVSPVNIPLGIHIEGKDLTSFPDPLDTFQELPASTRRIESSKLQTRSRKQSLSKKDRMRTKVRATPYQRLTEGTLVDIATSVHAIGKRQMRTLAVLQRVQKDYQTGSYKVGDLKADLKELDIMIAEAERELSQLQSDVAAQGTSQLVGKVEEAISHSIGLIGELKAKKAELEPLADENYEQASKALQTVRDNVRDSINEPKRAGVLMGKAYEAHESFQSLLLPTVGGSDEVSKQIKEMQLLAKTLLESAKSEKTVDLSTHKHDLAVDLKYTDSPKKAAKILSNPETERRVEEILSKKITAALWANPHESSKLIVEIDEILDFIATYDSGMLHRIHNSEDLKPLIDRYKREKADPNRQNAVRLRREIRVLINEISSSDKDRALVLHKAISKRDEIVALLKLLEKNPDIEKRGALENILGDVDSLIEQTGKKHLKLTKDKAQLRKTILNKDKKIKGEVYQVKRVLANDMMRLLVDIDTVISEEQRGQMKELFKSKKVDVSESHVLDLIDQIKDRRPELYTNIFSDPEMLVMLNRCQLKFINVEIDRCKMNFSEWAKVGTKLNNHFDTLVAQADEFSSLGPAKEFISANTSPSSDRIANVQKLRADIAARKKQLSKSTDAKELEQLSKLDHFAARFLTTHEELVNTQKILEIKVRDIDMGIKKMGTITDKTLHTQVGQLRDMLSKINEYVSGRKPAADAFMYAQSLMPITNQIGAVNTIYVDTFEIQSVRNAPETFAIERLTDEISRLQSIDTQNQQGYAQFAELINQYAEAYSSVGTMFKGLYDGSSGGPYTIKSGQSLTDEQVQFLDYLDQVHTFLLAELDKIDVQDTKYGQLFDTHIENFKLVVKNKIKDVAAIRGQVKAPTTGATPLVSDRGSGQYQILPLGHDSGKPTAGLSPQYVSARSPQTQYQGASMHQIYREGIGGKHVRSAPNQENVKALLADIDRLAQEDPQHEKEWNELRYCLATLNDTYVKVGDIFDGFYTPIGEIIPNPQFDENRKGWIEWMDGWQKHLESAMPQIEVDQSTPLGTYFELVQGIIQDKSEAVNALAAAA